MKKRAELNLELTQYTNFGMNIIDQESIVEKDRESDGVLKIDIIILGYEYIKNVYLGILVCEKSGSFSDYSDGSPSIFTKTCVCNSVDNAKKELIKIYNAIQINYVGGELYD